MRLKFQKIKIPRHQPYGALLPLECVPKTVFSHHHVDSSLLSERFLFVFHFPKIQREIDLKSVVTLKILFHCQFLRREWERGGVKSTGLECLSGEKAAEKQLHEAWIKPSVKQKKVHSTKGDGQETAPLDSDIE